MPAVMSSSPATPKTLMRCFDGALRSAARALAREGRSSVTHGFYREELGIG